MKQRMVAIIPKSGRTMINPNFTVNRLIPFRIPRTKYGRRVIPICEQEHNIMSRLFGFMRSFVRKYPIIANVTIIMNGL